MLMQKTSQSFLPALLVAVFLLSSPNASSDGFGHIEFLQKIGADKDQDVYIVTPVQDPSDACVDWVSPASVLTVPGNGRTMSIHYVDTGICDRSWASVLFKVKGKDHSERSAQLLWFKDLHQNAYAVIGEDADPDGLLWIDNSDSSKIKVWVSYDPGAAEL
ncbi:hypothetical protein [Endozoicomonas sp. 4G]|uniref:hypothetical protein n=1 Tax=Endozoicomonas sp. 4G TaxID=2872754 RepID=UPI002078D155|nr:hypothetical protein [Endozoicomonas sp. 4G]